MQNFVKFEEVGQSPSGRTRIWLIKNSHSDFEIGRIRWYSNWRKYVFEPAANCIFDTGCLGQIAEFINSQMEERKCLSTTK